MTERARALLETAGLKGPQHAQVTLERALDRSARGPAAAGAGRRCAARRRRRPRRAFRYAEALFFSGLADSAKTVYQDVTSKADRSLHRGGVSSAST